jgi:hypothetical protein
MNGKANDQEFLRHEIEDLDHKIAHLRHGLETCDDYLETDGLQHMLDAALIEHDLVNGLLRSQSGPGALSLDCAIIQQIAGYRQRASRLSHGWRRGHPIPESYWEAQTRYLALERLLRRLHAVRAGRPVYGDRMRAASWRDYAMPRPLPDPTRGADSHSHPWLLAGWDAESEHDNHRALARTIEDLDALAAKVGDTLDEARIPRDHLDVIIEPGGQAIVTGHVHSEDEHQRVIDVILLLDQIDEVISDIKVVTPETCPACHPELYREDDVTGNTAPRPNGRQSNGQRSNGHQSNSRQPHGRGLFHWLSRA